MAEVIKYGLIRDRAFLMRLNTIIDDVITLNDDYIAEVIQISCQHKADVVEADEKEHGERATLNLGHTFGHSVELLTHYTTYLHGEAVAIGTMMAMDLSRLRGWLSEEDIIFTEKLFHRAGCPTDLQQCSVNLTATSVREAMQRDKKVRAGKLKLILLSSLGKAIISSDSEEELIMQAIAGRL